MRHEADDWAGSLREGIAQLRLAGHAPPQRYWLDTGEVQPVDTCDVYRALLEWFLRRKDCPTTPDGVHAAFWAGGVDQVWPSGRDGVCTCGPPSPAFTDGATCRP